MAAGVIAEFDPFHGGHAHLLDCASRGGAEPVVVVMSGSFPQRGAPACAGKMVRARMAAELGADLVLELPVARALAPAEVFADGGVRLLAATGVVDRLVFGSESGDAALLDEAAAWTGTEAFAGALRDGLAAGKSYAAAAGAAYPPVLRAAAMGANDLLGIEYLRAIRAGGYGMTVQAVRRVGAGHGRTGGGTFPSATAVRRQIAAGVPPEALPLPGRAVELLREEAAAGRFPLDRARLEAAALGILTRLGPEGIAAAPEAGEGLSNRIAAAAAAAETLDELLARAKCRRYTMARIRRCVWQAVLGITAEDQAATPPVLRVLAVGPRGRELLAGMKRTAALPVVTKPAAVNRLDGAARRAAALEARADSLRSLGLAAREELFRQTPFIFGSDRG